MITNQTITSIHMLHCIFGLLCRFKLNISVAPTRRWMQSVNRKLNKLDSPIRAEYLGDVFLGDIACKSADMDPQWLRCGRALLPLTLRRWWSKPIISFTIWIKIWIRYDQLGLGYNTSSRLWAATRAAGVAIIQTAIFLQVFIKLIFSLSLWKTTV